MTYTNPTDVRTSTGTQDNSNITDTYVNAKIAMAEGIVNGKLGDVYNLPLEEVPDLVKAVALNLSAALIYIDQFGNETEGTGIDGQKLFDSTMDTLDLIWTQKIKLRKSDGTELLRSSLLKPSGYPNGFSTSSGESCRSFTKEKVF